MKLLKRIAAVLLAVCMVLPATACSMGDTSWVYDYDDVEITAGMYITFQMNAYAAVSEHEDYNEELDFWAQTLEGKSTEEYIRYSAEGMADEYVATVRKFNELGLTLSAADNNEIDETVEEYYGGYKETYEANGVGEASYRKLIEAQNMRYKIFLKYYGEGGIEEVPLSDLEIYFRENYASVNVLSYWLKEEDDDEAKAENEEIRAKVEQYQQLIDLGTKTFAEVYDEWQHEMLGTEHTDDEITYTDAELATYLTTDSTYPSEAVIKKVFQLPEDGRPHIIEEEGTLYLLIRYDVMKDEKNLEEMRGSVLADVKSDDFLEVLDSWSEGLTHTTNEAAYNRYSPKNIKLS